MIDKPHSRLEHWFVVLRIDDFSVEAPVEDCISAVSVFRDRAKANAEADRLNELVRGKNSRYIVRISRLKGEPAPPADRDR